MHRWRGTYRPVRFVAKMLVLGLCLPGLLPAQARAPALGRPWPDFAEGRRKTRPDNARGGELVDRLIGITLWRPPADPAGPAPRLLPGAQVAEGERVRLGVELVGRGYVYVIRRTLLAGGAVGPPFLVFPTPRGSPSANVAARGRLIEVPDRADLPSGFTLARSSPEQMGTRFTVLVTSSPLNAPAGGGPNPLPAALVAAWERLAAEPSSRLDATLLLEPQETPAEAASAAGARLLGSADPLPQSIVQIRAAADDPTAFSIDLKFQ